MMLDQAKIIYSHFNLDRSTDDLAEAAYRGIMNEPYPVVFIDGVKLPPATPAEYFKQIQR